MPRRNYRYPYAKIGHHSPQLGELLRSPQKDIAAAFTGEFAGMTNEDVSLALIVRL